MRRIAYGLLAGAALIATACSDSGDTAEEEVVALTGYDSTLAAQREVDRTLEKVNNPDSVFQAALTQSPDAVVGRIKVGMSIQLLPAIIGKGPMTAQGVDTLKLRDGFRQSLAVVAPDLFTVIWFRKQAGTPSEPIVRSVETPIVMKNEVVVGTGWEFYDKVRAGYSLPAVP